MPGDDRITSVSDLDEAEETSTVGAEEANQEETAKDESQEIPGTESDEKVPVEEGTNESSNDPSEEEIEKILSLGKKVLEYQQSHPGFDPIAIHGEFTKKSMELAEFKRQKIFSEEHKPETKQEEEKIDLTDVDQTSVELVEKILKAKGYVKKEELNRMKQDEFKSTYDSVKQKEINSFLEKFPQYRPENDLGDAKWTSLLEEFSIFKLPQDPSKIGVLLEKAHKSLGGSTDSIDVKKVTSKLIAQQRVNKMNKTTSASSGGSAGNSKASKSLLDVAKKNLKGFTEEELTEMFGN